MIELRWAADWSGNKVLQYRQKVDTTIRAGMSWSVDQLAMTANYEWTEWTDVPTFTIPPQYDITAENVRELSEMCDVSLMTAKKAMVACGGNIVNATEWLRVYGRNLA